MPASPSIRAAIGSGSATPALIVHRSSPSKATSRWSRPIGPIFASRTLKCSGSEAATAALPGVRTIGWSDVGPPNWVGSATRRPTFEEVLSAFSSAVAPVILRPLSRPVGLTFVKWMPSARPQLKVPSSRVTGAPLAVNVTLAPVEETRSEATVTVRPVIGVIVMPLTMIGSLEVHCCLRWRRQMPVARRRPATTVDSHAGSSSRSVIAVSAVAPASSVTFRRTVRLPSSTILWRVNVWVSVGRRPRASRRRRSTRSGRSTRRGRPSRTRRSCAAAPRARSGREQTPPGSTSSGDLGDRRLVDGRRRRGRGLGRRRRSRDRRGRGRGRGGRRRRRRGSPRL